MTRVVACLCSVLIVLAACGKFPDLDDTISDRVRGAEFPQLVPLDQLLDIAFASAGGAQAEAAGLAVRAARLRVRAAAMRRPVVNRRTRARMAAALRRHAS